jgi:ketosteroid isomerase-like protein
MNADDRDLYHWNAPGVSVVQCHTNSYDKIMKPHLCIISIISLIITVLAGPVAQAEEDRVKNRVEAWVAAFNENKPEKMASFYENTEDLDMLVSAGLWHRGIGEIKKAYEKDEKSWAYYDSSSRNLRIRDLGDVALASFEHRFKLRSLDEDMKFQVHIRTTMTLRKIDSEWKIVSEHSSAIHGVERATVVNEEDDAG